MALKTKSVLLNLVEFKSIFARIFFRAIYYLCKPHINYDFQHPQICITCIIVY
jgi:hypothetical protein